MSTTQSQKQWNIVISRSQKKIHNVFLVTYLWCISRLDVKFYAKTGGFKEIFDQNINKVLRTNFNGIELNRTVRVIFDLVPPTHCSLYKSCDADDWGFPLAVMPDVTEVSLIENKSLSWHNLKMFNHKNI